LQETVRPSVLRRIHFETILPVEAMTGVSQFTQCKPKSAF
jgi:hypothetical protein